MKKFKVGKTPGTDDITAKMVKYGGGVVVEWMLWICGTAWEQGKVPEDWRRKGSYCCVAGSVCKGLR